MSMIDLMQQAERLNPGGAINLEIGILWKAAESNLTSLMLDSVRQSDVKELAEYINANWDGIKIRLNVEYSTFTMSRKVT